jgi:hypothetical protein
MPRFEGTYRTTMYAGNLFVHGRIYADMQDDMKAGTFMLCYDSTYRTGTQVIIPVYLEKTLDGAVKAGRAQQPNYSFKGALGMQSIIFDIDMATLEGTYETKMPTDRGTFRLQQTEVLPVFAARQGVEVCIIL